MTPLESPQSCQPPVGEPPRPRPTGLPEEPLRAAEEREVAHLPVLPVADFGEVQPRHHAEPGGQPLQEQPDERRQQQDPEQLRERRGREWVD